MIYKINKACDTRTILRDDPPGLIIFDLAPNVDAMEIAVAYKECTHCQAVSIFDLDEVDREYCDEDCCEGYLDGSYAALVLQGDKVVFALHRRNG